MQTPLPHWFGTPPPPQVWPAMVQMPQSIVPPQPSGWSPQLAPCEAHVAGVQGGAPHGGEGQLGMPHTLATPAPPHSWPAGQTPHWRKPPRPSLSTPQLALALAQVMAMQVGSPVPALLEELTPEVPPVLHEVPPPMDEVPTSAPPPPDDEEEKVRASMATLVPQP
jgi:hypothetical protein